MTVTDPDVPDPLNDPRTLQAQLVETYQGQQWFGRVSNFGFVYEAENVDDIRLPAAPERVLRDVIGLDAEPYGGPAQEGSSP